MLARLPINKFNTAQAIRLNAGIEDGETTGVTSGVTPGVTAGTTYTDTDGLLISAESVISTAADSGTGTANDPYILDSRRFDNSEAGTIAINWSHAAPDYHIKFTNCLFYGYSTVILRFSGASSTGSITFQNCEFYAASGYILDIRAAHVCTFDKCLISQSSANAIVPNTNWTGTFTCTDTRFDDSQGAWGATSTAICSFQSTAGTIDVDDCEFVAETQGAIYGGCRLSDPNTVTFDNCLFDNLDYGIHDAGDDNLAGGTFTNCLFRNMVENNVYLRNVDGVRLVHCDFKDTPADKRNVYFYSDYSAVGPTLTKYARNSYLIRCKGTKTSGTDIAGNEVFEFFDPDTCGFIECWIDGATEDCYEIVRPIGTCVGFNNVVDNATGEAFDVYKTQDVVTSGRVLIFGLYGENNADYGVINKGCSDVICKDILLDNSDSAVELIKIEDVDAVVPTRCNVAGYTSTTAMTGNGIYSDTSTGTNTDNSTPYTAVSRS